MAWRLLIADDHPVVREGLKTFLDLQGDLQVVAESEGLADTLAAARASLPDLVLLDLQLRDGNGLKLLPDLLALSPAPKVLILTSFSDETSVRTALRRGACGYLLKHSGPGTLLDHVRSALRGEIPLDPSVVRLLAEPEDDPLATLTPREREILGLIARGMSNKQIGAELGIAEKTVKTHAGNLFAKLEVRDRVQAALLAKDRGF